MIQVEDISTSSVRIVYNVILLVSRDVYMSVIVCMCTLQLKFAIICVGPITGCAIRKEVNEEKQTFFFCKWWHDVIIILYNVPCFQVCKKLSPPVKQKWEETQLEAEARRHNARRRKEIWLQKALLEHEP